MFKKKSLSLACLSLTFISFQNFTYIQHNSSSSNHYDMTTCNTSFDGGYDIFVVAGQSNAVGSGKGHTSENKSFLRPEILENICQISGRIKNDNQIQIIDAGSTELQHVSYNNDGNRGFAVSFARRYVRDVLKPGRKILLIPVALGSTSILAWDQKIQDLSGYADNSDLFDNMSFRVQKALLQNSKNELKGVFWQQGEADIMAMSGGSKWHPVLEGTDDDVFYNSSAYWNSNEYFNFRSRIHRIKLKQLYTSLNKRFCLTKGEEDCFAFLLGRPVYDWKTWNVNYINASGEEVNITRDVSLAHAELVSIYENLAAEKDNIRVIDTRFLKSNADVKQATSGHGDNYHFSSEGLRLLGHRYFIEFIDLLEGR
ncbi:MAG: sialate O-acetylesterase [Bdellovibrionales bacterium]